MAVYLKAYQAYQHKNYDQCLKLLQELKPSDTKRLDLQAQVHFRRKEYQKAYDIYQQLIDREPEYREERKENVQTLIACAQLEQPGTLVTKPRDHAPKADEIIDQVQMISLKDSSVYDLLQKNKKSRRTKKLKRKIRLPKQYDPNSEPDPERWLPRRDRKGNAHKQKKRRPRPGNTKGGKARGK